MKFGIYAIKSLFFSSNWYKKLALKKKEGLEITKPLNFKKIPKIARCIELAYHALL